MTDSSELGPWFKLLERITPERNWSICWRHVSKYNWTCHHDFRTLREADDYPLAKGAGLQSFVYDFSVYTPNLFKRYILTRYIRNMNRVEA